jgi:uncharacterized membrane protein
MSQFRAYAPLLTLRWPILILAIGIGLSAFLGLQLQQRATDTWQKRAEQAAAQQSVTMLGWIEESYGMLSGIAALVENSGEVDAGEFLNAVHGMESRAKVNFVQIKALLENGNDGWRIKYSSATSQTDAGFPRQDAPPSKALQDLLSRAKDTPNEWLMSLPFTDASGKHHVLVVLISSAKPDFAVVGVLALQRMMESMTASSASAGMFLDLNVKVEEKDTPVSVRTAHATASIVFDSHTLTHTARTNFDQHWKFTQDFDGGSDLRLARSVWGGGTLLSILMAVFVAALLQQNRQVQQRVEIATRDIEKAMALKSEIAALSIALQQTASPSECGAVLLSRFAERFGCRQGMLAIATPSGELDVVARYGAAPSDRSKSRYSINEGVVGQCARERKVVHLVLPADEAWRIHSGLGSTGAAEVWFFPIEHGGVLIGVIELATLAPLESGDQALLVDAMPVISLRLADLQRRITTETGPKP